MMPLIDVCHAINLAPPMISKIAPLLSSSEILSAKEHYISSLSHPDTWTSGVVELIHRLGTDPDGSKLLAVMLLCSMTTQKTYEEKGIDLHIFTESMKYCSEYIDVFYAAYGSYVFEARRAKWFPRQLSLHEFRIQALEFEMCIENGEKRIYIHIPPKTDLSDSSVRSAYSTAKEFFARYFPEYADADMYCDSWLLSPALPGLLPPDSRIVQFQNAFDVDTTDYDTNAFIEWVFQRNDLPLNDLPEDTLLRKNMKAYLLQGGKIGWSHGKLKLNFWQ